MKPGMDPVSNERVSLRLPSYFQRITQGETFFSHVGDPMHLLKYRRVEGGTT